MAQEVHRPVLKSWLSQKLKRCFRKGQMNEFDKTSKSNIEHQQCPKMKSFAHVLMIFQTSASTKELFYR